MGALPSIDMTATGVNIFQMRQRMGMTVQDLQNIFGFSTPQAIYKWQRGETLPTVENLAALAHILGVAVEDILVVEYYQK